MLAANVHLQKKGTPFWDALLFFVVDRLFSQRAKNGLN